MRRHEPDAGDSWLDRVRHAVRGRPSRRTDGDRYVARPVGRPQGRQPMFPYAQRAPARTNPNAHAPYAIAFLVMIAVLAAFLYVGLSWATGAGKSAGLPATGAPAALPSPSPVARAATPAPSPVTARTHVVRAGDTPDAIARQFSVSVDSLLRENNLTDPRALQVGQVLKIPPATQ